VPLLATKVEEDRWELGSTTREIFIGFFSGYSNELIVTRYDAFLSKFDNGPVKIFVASDHDTTGVLGLETFISAILLERATIRKVHIFPLGILPCVYSSYLHALRLVGIEIEVHREIASLQDANAFALSLLNRKLREQ
jgi:hypothetical protein